MTKADGYPATPELDRMKRQKVALGLDAVARFLEEAAECRLPLSLLVGNEPLVKRLTEDRTARGHVHAFLVWIEHQLEVEGDAWRMREGDEDQILFPSERLFAAYAEIDLQEVEFEKRCVLAFVRGEPQPSKVPETPPMTMLPLAKGAN